MNQKPIRISIQNLWNMNQPTWTRNHAETIRSFVTRHFKDISKKTETSKTFQKNRAILQKMHPHASDFCHQSCLPDSWWLASSIDQRPSRQAKEKMTSQQIKTDSYHVLSCSDKNYQIQILTIHSPEVLQNQIYPEDMQKLARDSSIVVPEFSEQSCKIARPGLTEAMGHSQVLQQKGSCSQPTWIRNQWESLQNLSNMNQKPLKIFAEPFKHESANMNQKPMRIYAEPFKHESANMSQKPMRIYAEPCKHESANMGQKPRKIYAEPSNMNQPTWIRNQWESMQNLSNRTQPAWIRNQWESMQNLSNMNQPTWIRNQWESMQNLSNMNQPTWIRNQWELCRTFQTWISQHESETNENLCRTFQTWISQHESETNENLCRTFQTWISQHEPETMRNTIRTFTPNMQTTSTRPAEQYQQITRCSHHGTPPPLHQKLQRPNHLQGSRANKKKQNIAANE